MITAIYLLSRKGLGVDFVIVLLTIIADVTIFSYVLDFLKTIYGQC